MDKPIIAEHIAAWYPEGSTGWLDARRPGPTGVVLVVGHKQAQVPWQRWGTGATLDAAKRNWQWRSGGQGGRLSDGYTVYTFDADTEFHGVDDMGRYSYRGNPPQVREVKSRVLASQP